MIVQRVKKLPTAFDKEKVIEELKDAKDIPHDDSSDMYWENNKD